MSKVVLVTGASSGIGAATTRRLAADGHHVFVGARRTDRLAELVVDLQARGSSAGFQELDVTSLDSMRAFVAAARARYGRVDVLVNNAGVMPLSRVDESELTDRGGDPAAQRAARAAAQQLAIPASAVADAIAYAVAQPPAVDVGEIVVRPTAQG